MGDDLAWGDMIYFVTPDLQSTDRSTRIVDL